LFIDLLLSSPIQVLAGFCCPVLFDQALHSVPTVLELLYVLFENWLLFIVLHKSISLF
jgi:hypothetical protein